MTEELPAHLKQFPVFRKQQHYVVVPAIVHNEPRMYSIVVKVARAASPPIFEFRRWVVGNSVRPPRMVCTGSGITAFLRGIRPVRHLLRLIRASNAGTVSAEAVATEFARINLAVSKATADESVGETCAIAVRFPPAANRGGEEWRFSETELVANDVRMLPTVSNGWPMDAIVNALSRATTPALSALLAGREPGYDLDAAAKAALELVPDTPDKRLR